MKSHLFRVGQHTLIYGLGGVALQVVGVFTLPIFARIFSPAQYGVVEIANVGYALLLLLIDFGFASASQRHFFDYTEEQPGERRIVLSTATLHLDGIALSIALVLVVLRHPISDAFFDGHNYADVVALVAVTLPVGNLANFFREVMRLHDQPWHYAIASMLSAVVTGGVAVSLVAGADVGVKGIFIAVLTGQLVMAVYGLVVSGRNIGLGFFEARAARDALLRNPAGAHRHCSLGALVPGPGHAEQARQPLRRGAVRGRWALRHRGDAADRRVRAGLRADHPLDLLAGRGAGEAGARKAPYLLGTGADLGLADPQPLLLESW